MLEMETSLALVVLQLRVAEFPDNRLEGLAANQFIAGSEGADCKMCTSSVALTLPPELVAVSV
jgi:hypothetical protein